MERPYIFCHMMTSLDGKIMGNYMETPNGSEAGDMFYNIAFGQAPFYQHQGWLSGLVTTDDNFTFYKKPALDENALDYLLVLSKLKELFHIETLMLGGGGVLNWSFLQAGLCDDVSLVVAASADTNPDTPPVFRAKAGLSTDRALDFTLKEAKVMGKNTLWLRYLV